MSWSLGAVWAIVFFAEKAVLNFSLRVGDKLSHGGDTSHLYAKTIPIKATQHQNTNFSRFLGPLLRHCGPLGCVRIAWITSGSEPGFCVAFRPGRGTLETILLL